MSKSGWIAVDLDGTLAYYQGWQGAEHIGPPVMRMVDRVKSWLQKGETVKIFTARVSGGGELAAEQVKLIKEYCLKHIGQELEVTCIKDFACIEIWDDRCIQVMTNTGKTMHEVIRGDV